MTARRRLGLIAGTLGGLVLFLALRRRAKAEEIVYVCPYCGAEFATEEELCQHIEQEHPEEPIIGYMEGYVLNAVTGAKLPRGSAMLTIDGTQIIYNDLGVGGAYPYFRAYLQHGRSYHFTVEASGYYTGEFDVFMPTKYDRHNFTLVPWEGSDYNGYSSIL